MEKRQPSAKSTERYEDVGAALAARGVTMSQMFGMPCLKANKKAFAGLTGDAMVFKLTGGQHAAALKIKGAELFDPGMGRPMKEWVVVPAARAARWQEFAEAALDYVSR